MRRMYNQMFPIRDIHNLPEVEYGGHQTSLHTFDTSHYREQGEYDQCKSSSCRTPSDNVYMCNADVVS